jgi:hypothetical protein
MMDLDYSIIEETGSFMELDIPPPLKGLNTHQRLDDQLKQLLGTPPNIVQVEQYISFSKELSHSLANAPSLSLIVTQRTVDAILSSLYHAISLAEEYPLPEEAIQSLVSVHDVLEKIVAKYGESNDLNLLRMRLKIQHFNDLIEMELGRYEVANLIHHNIPARTVDEIFDLYRDQVQARTNNHAYYHALHFLLVRDLRHPEEIKDAGFQCLRRMHDDFPDVRSEVIIENLSDEAEKFCPVGTKNLWSAVARKVRLDLRGEGKWNRDYEML